MNDEDLQKWVERVSLQYFELPFLHRAVFNKRLNSTGGRYFMTNHNIEISWKQYETHGADEVEKIIKHELCHYHLHLQKKGYKHRDADFKQLLLQVGGTKHCKPIQANKRRPVRDYRYKLICTSCRQEYWRKNKVNLHRYACGKCRGTLQIVRLDAEIKK